MTYKYTYKFITPDRTYESELLYPLTITDKGLDESLNLYEFSFLDSSADPLYTNLKTKLEVYENDSKIKEYDLILVSDVVAEGMNNSPHTHNVKLIEWLYWYDQILLPDLTITRMRDIYEPNLLDVLNRVLKIARQEFNLPEIVISARLATELLEDSPEWVFRGYTLLEVIRKIVGYVGYIPYMESQDLLDYREHGGTAEFLAKGRTNTTYNPQRDKTGLKTSAQNLISQKPIIEPNPQMGLTPRSPDQAMITADNLVLQTAYPVYEIVDVFFPGLKLKHYDLDSRKVEVDINFRHLNSPRWRDWLVEKQVYDSLPLKETLGDRGGAIYYTQGQRNIEGLTYRAPGRWSWSSNPQAWRTILQDVILLTGYKLTDIIQPGIASHYKTLLDEAWSKVYGVEMPNYGFFAIEKNGKRFSEELVPMDFEMVISYIPYIEADIYTYRERKQPNENIIKTFQNYNQIDGTTESSILAELHDKVLISNIGKGQEFDYDFDSLDAAPKTGQRVNNYIVSATVKDLFYGSVRARYQLDEHMTKLNEYVSVLEKRRESLVPQDNVVRSQRTIHRFFKFSDDRTYSASDIRANDFLDMEQNRVLHMYRPFPGIAYPINSFPFNNSIIMLAESPNHSYLGNKAKGKMTDEKLEDDPIPLYDRSGSLLNGTGRLKFALKMPDSLGNGWSRLLPEAPAGIQDGILSIKEFDYDFDARERPAFSLQLHFVDETQKVRISPHMATSSKLVGGLGYKNLSLIFHNIEVDKYIKSSEATYVVGNQPIAQENASTVRLPRAENRGMRAAFYSVGRWDNKKNRYDIFYTVKETVAGGAMPQQLYIRMEEDF